MAYPSSRVVSSYRPPHRARNLHVFTQCQHNLKLHMSDSELIISKHSSHYTHGPQMCLSPVHGTATYQLHNSQLGVNLSAPSPLTVLTQHQFWPKYLSFAFCGTGD